MVVIALPNLFILYAVFAPLTLYPVYFMLNLFYGAELLGRTIVTRGVSVELIDACIAGSAYYLLLVLNLSLPEIRIGQRIKMISFAFSMFLVINVFRIFLSSILYFNFAEWFDFAHKLFWYLGSVVFVVGVWFVEVKIFKIKQIPFYSDLKFLHHKI